MARFRPVARHVTLSHHVHPPGLSPLASDFSEPVPVRSLSRLATSAKNRLSSNGRPAELSCVLAER